MRDRDFVKGVSCQGTLRANGRKGDYLTIFFQNSTRKGKLKPLQCKYHKREPFR